MNLSQGRSALSMTESKYIAKSSATQEVLPLMELVQEMNEKGCGLSSYPRKVICRVF
jgi:hypothetical protein